KKNYKASILTVIALALGLGAPLAALAAGPLPVNLGTAGSFALLAETTITTTGATAITGNVGISPAAASFLQGFSLSADPSNTFSTSALVTGKVYASNYAPPTPAYMTGAISDMDAAYVDAAGRATPTASNVDAGILGGETFTPGLYNWTNNVTIAAGGTPSTTITLAGGPNDVWIFQIAGNLTVADGGNLGNGAQIVLTGGAQAQNVFWQVGGPTGATLGAYSTFNGTILSAKQIIMNAGAVLNGNALAQSQITMIANTVALPAGSAPATLNVIKLVVNANGGTAVPSDFTIHVTNASTTLDVAGSPLPGVAAPGTPYSLAPGTYTVSENSNTSYTQSFTGNCNSSGTITLIAGQVATCTMVNTDIPAPAPVASGGGGGGAIVPLIGITKVPAPLTLPAGPGPVTYTYTVWNVGGNQPLTGVTVTDDKCSPVTYVSGDVNNNSALDPGENWKYSCTTTLASTTTNTAIATGHTGTQTAIATAVATVVVGAPAAVVPPLINIVKVPSRLTPFPFGGGTVTYTYTVTNPGVVPLSNVSVTDNKCSPVNFLSGDTNGNGLLDAGEVWTYACSTNITASTMNTATADGTANGLTAIGYAFATVLVAAPGLPNTGFPPAGNSVPWIILIVAGISVATLFYFIRKKAAA
ncbi:MAG TPA: ice-binding family protein, partial [Candidatus Paceibacterota bacterium]|nr:ice-binding family protein [Candidatus Paceibacterota bacterium]